MKKKSIVVVVSSPMTISSFLLNHVNELSKHFTVSLVANFDGRKSNFDFSSKIRVYDIPIPRKISILNDFKSLIQLTFIFKKNKFDAIYSVTPKAGLLSMMAGRLAGVKLRVHTFTGQVWANKTGLKRKLLKLLDSVTSHMASKVLVDSHSQREFLINEGVVSEFKSSVLCSGSISGVDICRFCLSEETRYDVRHKLNIAKDEKVILFIGRLNRDKGISELVEAFCRIHIKLPKTILLIVGPDEELMKDNLTKALGSTSSSVRFIPFTNEPERMMQASDVLCLPSYREGFGSVVIEAAACGLPSIGSNIYGLKDAIEDGVTGELVELQSIDDLFFSLERVLTDDTYRKKLGMSARKRVVKEFSNELLSHALIDFYNREL